MGGITELHQKIKGRGQAIWVGRKSGGGSVPSLVKVWTRNLDHHVTRERK